MASNFVRVKHREHGGVASLPESALPHFPEWEPVDGPLPARPKSKKKLPSQQPLAAPAASKETE